MKRAGDQIVLVGGEVVDIVRLSLAGGPHTDYSKTCEAVPDGAEVEQESA